MAELTEKEKAREALIRYVGFKRANNPYLETTRIRMLMATYGITPEDIGTTEAELQTFFKQDCRWQLESDLENWRVTNSIGHPEQCFAEGVIEALEKGELRPEDFGIAEQELKDIRKTAGLD